MNRNRQGIINDEINEAMSGNNTYKRCMAFKTEQTKPRDDKTYNKTMLTLRSTK